MQMASSAKRTGKELRSASLYTATVLMPNSLQAQMTRSAISPRFAMSIFLNIGSDYFGRIVNSAWPYSTGCPLLTSFFKISPATSDSISFISFIASTMHNTVPTSTVSPAFTNGGEPGEGASKNVPTMGDFTLCRPASSEGAAAAEEAAATDAGVGGATAAGLAWGSVMAGPETVRFSPVRLMRTLTSPRSSSNSEIS